VLARKERALRIQAKQLSEERAALHAEREAAKGSVASPAATATTTPPAQAKSFSQERLLTDPVGALEELGFTPEQIAQKLLNHTPVDPRITAYVNHLEKQLAEVKASQDETRKTLDTRETDSVAQAIDNIRFEAEQLVESDPNFATIKATGQTEEIVTLIKGVFDEGLPGKFRKGTLLTVEQAAALVEEELEAQWIEQHEKLSRIEKIQKRLAAKNTPAKPGTPNGTSTPATGQQQIKTLSNNMTPGSSKPMSARDRAIAVFNGQKVS